jgi:hypothetical protein
LDKELVGICLAHSEITYKADFAPTVEASGKACALSLPLSATAKSSLGPDRQPNAKRDGRQAIKRRFQYVAHAAPVRN